MAIPLAVVALSRMSLSVLGMISAVDYGANAIIKDNSQQVEETNKDNFQLVEEINKDMQKTFGKEFEINILKEKNKGINNSIAALNEFNSLGKCSMLIYVNKNKENEFSNVLANGTLENSPTVEKMSEGAKNSLTSLIVKHEYAHCYDFTNKNGDYGFTYAPINESFTKIYGDRAVNDYIDFAKFNSADNAGRLAGSSTLKQLHAEYVAEAFSAISLQNSKIGGTQEEKNEALRARHDMKLEEWERRKKVDLGGNAKLGIYSHATHKVDWFFQTEEGIELAKNAKTPEDVYELAKKVASSMILHDMANDPNFKAQVNSDTYWNANVISQYQIPSGATHGDSDLYQNLTNEINERVSTGEANGRPLTKKDIEMLENSTKYLNRSKKHGGPNNSERVSTLNNLVKHLDEYPVPSMVSEYKKVKESLNSASCGLEGQPVSNSFSEFANPACFQDSIKNNDKSYKSLEPIKDTTILMSLDLSQRESNKFSPLNRESIFDIKLKSPLKP